MTATVISDSDGKKLLDWVSEESWQGGIEVYVSTRCYTGNIEPEWVPVRRVSTGATPYPVKGEIPGAGNGQWNVREILAVRITDTFATSILETPHRDRAPEWLLALCRVAR